MSGFRSLVIMQFLSGLGAMLGPLYGILMVDYFLIRKTRCHIPDLYTEDPRGTYYFKRGINPGGLLAFLPSAVLSIILGLVPRFEDLVSFSSWLIGAGLAALLYYLVSDRKRIYIGQSADYLSVGQASY